MHADNDKHHKESSLIKAHQNPSNPVKYAWKNMEIVNNPVKYELIIE